MFIVNVSILFKFVVVVVVVINIYFIDIIHVVIAIMSNTIICVA